ncbi:hypothetical protein M758_1G300000 [Ceratodon purpureus]|nr:hypothetical protein M758_1G300000 [Ceratodon purpureus]
MEVDDAEAGLVWQAGDQRDESELAETGINREGWRESCAGRAPASQQEPELAICDLSHAASSDSAPPGGRPVAPIAPALACLRAMYVMDVRDKGCVSLVVVILWGMCPCKLHPPGGGFLLRA